MIWDIVLAACAVITILGALLMVYVKVNERLGILTTYSKVHSEAIVRNAELSRDAHAALTVKIDTVHELLTRHLIEEDRR